MCTIINQIFLSMVYLLMNVYLLSNYSGFIVTFTRRQANGSAHALARAALTHAFCVTFDVITTRKIEHSDSHFEAGE
jgi:hypothetical protein